jgi:hypothetical protein
MVDVPSARGVAAALRRHWMALLGVALLVLAPLTPWILVADVHSAPAWTPVDTDRPAPAVMDEVTDQLREVDHRRVSRAYLVDNGTQTPYATYEVVREFSSYQFVANYVRRGKTPDDASLFGQQFPARISIGTPVQVVQYNDDTLRGWGYRTAVDPSVLPDSPVGNRSVSLPANVSGVTWQRTDSLDPNATLAGLYRPYFSPRGGGWEVVSRNDSTVVVGIDDPEAVFATVPMEARAVHPGTRVRVVLDADTGRPKRVVEHRVVSQSVDGTVQRRHYLVVSRYAAWRTADAERPEWVGDGDFDSHVEDLLYY